MIDRLSAAVAAAPRRYRMPALPADLQSARDAGIDVALAFAIESARRGPVPEARELFVKSLAALIERALDPQAGDAAFQALVVRANEPSVQRYVALQASASQDARSVRKLVDAVAHPAKLAALTDEENSRRADLYQLAREGWWSVLRDRAEGVVESLAADASLQRLIDGEALRETEAVARYSSLVASQGLLAGSDAASAHGRNSARAGDAAEAQVLAALHEIAQVLHARGAAPLRVVGGLRTPPGFPGDRAKAKDEWDVALLESGSHAARIVLLGEVKASPAAAPPDFSRLYRGLLRFGDADGGSDYTFTCSGGAVAIAGESLRALAPIDRALPKQVLYFSTAPAGQVPPFLSAASKAVLLGEAGSLAFARVRDLRLLDAVWEALTAEPRLRATLHQYDTARLVCEAMLHPADLLASVRAHSFGV